MHWNPHSILNVQTMEVYIKILINRYYLFHLILVIAFSQKMLCIAHRTYNSTTAFLCDASIVYTHLVRMLEAELPARGLCVYVEMRFRKYVSVSKNTCNSGRSSLSEKNSLPKSSLSWAVTSFLWELEMDAIANKRVLRAPVKSHHNILHRSCCYLEFGQLLESKTWTMPFYSSF